MPLYEYECEACKRRFERIQKFSDPLVETCPHCGGRVEKLLSSPAIQFKGSGWYITDYAKKSSGDGSKTSEGSAEKTTPSKTESKPDSKSDSTATSDGGTSKPAPAAKE